MLSLDAEVVACGDRVGGQHLIWNARVTRGCWTATAGVADCQESSMNATTSPVNSDRSLQKMRLTIIAASPTIAAMEIHRALTERFKAIWGNPTNQQADVLQWQIKCAPHLYVRLQLDLLTAPHLVSVWVFNPCDHNPDGKATHQYRVAGMNDVDRVVEEIKTNMKASSSLQ